MTRSDFSRALLTSPIDNSDYRFLIDGKLVKYMTAAPRRFRGAEDDRTFESILLGELMSS